MGCQKVGAGAASIISVAAVVVLWLALTTWTNTISAVRLPPPTDVWQDLKYLLSGPLLQSALVKDISASALVVLVGFVTGAVTGVLLGAAMGLSRYVEAAINPLFQLLRPIPPLAWIPLGILWFGLGFRGEVFIVWLAATVPALINTFTAIRSVDPVLIAAAEVHGARRGDLLLDVIGPAALPFVFTGLRLSLQLAWMAVVAAELMGSTAGLGREMIIATRNLDSGTIVVSMVAIAALGMAMTALLRLVEIWACPWR